MSCCTSSKRQLYYFNHSLRRFPQQHTYRLLVVTSINGVPRVIPRATTATLTRRNRQRQAPPPPYTSWLKNKPFKQEKPSVRCLTFSAPHGRNSDRPHRLQTEKKRHAPNKKIKIKSSGLAIPTSIMYKNTRRAPLSPL